MTVTSQTDQTNLPLGSELVAHVFALLSGKDLARAETTCVHWHELIQSHALWQKITEKTWRKHSTRSWATLAVLWEATSQKDWKRIYSSMLANWRIHERTVVSFLTGHSQPVTCLAASRNTIASGAADKTVRLWDRKTHTCRHILQLPSCPSAVHLLSDEVTVVTCMDRCSVWKGRGCLRTICPNFVGRSHICCTAVAENLLFLAAHGETTIHVWDLYSGLELQIFRPTDSGHIMSLAAGTVHGQQVLLAGTLDSRMLVLRQDDGQALSPPVEVAWRTPVDRIVLQEDDCAVVAGGFSRNRGYRAPKLVRFRKVQEQGNASCPTLTASISGLQYVRDPLAITRIEGTPIIVVVEQRQQRYMLGFHPMTQTYVEDSYGNHCYQHQMRPYPDTPTCRPWSGSFKVFVDKPFIVEHACGLLLTDASDSRVAVWQFPSCPESEM